MNASQVQVFTQYLTTLSPLDSNDLQALLSILSVRQYADKAHIVAPTEVNNTTFFMLSGLIRYYYVTSDGKEWNRAFLSGGMMSTSFSDDAGRIDLYGIQALENTQVLFARFSDFQALFDDHPMIERFHRKLVERILILKMNRERSFLQSSAQARYQDFAEQFPDVFQRVTQYHLASYLGVTEASLSRLIKTLR